MTSFPQFPQSDGLVGSTAIVTGASRGFGRAIATALSAAGAHVVGLARGSSALDELRDELGDTFTPVAADAADPATASRLLDEYRPRTLVLCAGAAPQMAPLQDQTWESFSQNWNMDVAQAFHWTRYALRRPLAPGSVPPWSVADSCQEFNCTLISSPFNLVSKPGVSRAMACPAHPWRIRMVYSQWIGR